MRRGQRVAALYYAPANVDERGAYSLLWGRCRGRSQLNSCYAATCTACPSMPVRVDSGARLCVERVCVLYVCGASPTCSQLSCWTRSLRICAARPTYTTSSTSRAPHSISMTWSEQVQCAVGPTYGMLQVPRLMLCRWPCGLSARVVCDNIVERPGIETASMAVVLTRAAAQSYVVAVARCQ